MVVDLGIWTKRSYKVARTGDSDATKTMPEQAATSDSGGGVGGQVNTLNFSPPRSEAALLLRNGGLAEMNTQNPTFRSGGFGVVVEGGGPFTQAQWVEIELQSLIYKCISANVPVPSSLIMSFQRSIIPSGFPRSPSGSLSSNSVNAPGSGSSRLGFSGKNSDPEPGRCRRTDGKKWRCSRDAVPDHKYCERHINRGRHRSRKPVEARNGQLVTAGSAATAKAAPQPVTSSPAAEASVMSSGGSSNSLGTPQHQFNSSGHVLVDRCDPRAYSEPSPTTKQPEPQKTKFSMPEPHISIGEAPFSAFGLDSSHSILNPPQESSSYWTHQSYNNSIIDLNEQEFDEQHLLCHFIDDWNNYEPKSVWAYPTIASDFSSTSSSSPPEKFISSRLGLAHEPDPSQISWGNITGGPLGEVLNSSDVNLTREAWNRCASFEHCPTALLHKTAFGSFSNGSSVSSPTSLGTKKCYGSGGVGDGSGSVGDEMLSSTLLNSGLGDDMPTSFLCTSSVFPYPPT